MARSVGGLRGIRTRSTALVTVALGAALVVGSLAITTVLTQRLEDNLDSTLQAAASDRAVLLAERADPATLTDTRLEAALVWIGTADGDVLAQGGRLEPVDGIPGLALDVVGTVSDVDVRFREVYVGDAEHEAEHASGGDIEEESLRVAVDAVIDGDRTIYVVVGAETEAIDQPVRDVVQVLLILAPALLVLVAVFTWVTADRALRPVETIRSSAAAVRDHRSGAQVDVPSTGDEIERLATTINEMLARLGAADERQRQFIGDASHELKSPLANLRVEIETGTDPERDRHLVQIDRLTALVDDLLTLAVLDSDVPLRRAVVDLDDVVFDVLAASAPTHDRMIEIDGVTPTRIVGDEAQLRRLVRNLVDNAVRHATGRVSVTLAEDQEPTVARRDSAVVLHIDDDGPGVPPDAVQSIFERFRRSDQARGRQAGGTGLGLAIVAQIVESHAGTIDVSTSPLGGARFTVRLPAGEPGVSS